ncbi:MAG: hypothetical protein JF586_14455 [Burkholderiales bacterium]|nr:hypothetical protein [Burkholderiales bacterium]
MVPARRAILPWLAAACAAVAAAAPAQEVQMRHLAKGMTTVKTRGNAFMVIRNADEFARALNQRMDVAGEPASADGGRAIDFDTEMALGVLLSNRPTACAGVDITSISKDGIVSVVHYRERVRKPHEACAATVTSPFDFVAIPKSGAPVRFQADGEP